MSENIYKDHYELQQAFQKSQQALQTVFNALYPLVSPEGVQMSLQEVLELTVNKLGRFQAEASEVSGEAHDSMGAPVEAEKTPKGATVSSLDGKKRRK